MRIQQVCPVLLCMGLLLLGGVFAEIIGPGEATVRVDIAVGESANITCRMNMLMFRGKNASDLYFIDLNNNQTVPRSLIEIVDESTIVYMLRNASEQNNAFRCKCGNDAIMDTNVSVGSAPANVTDFDCSNYDFEYMVCNFTRPYNPVMVTYNLTFRTHSPHYIYNPFCNYRSSPVVCNITGKNMINLNVQMYKFRLIAVNALDNNTQVFNIDSWKVIVPAKPGAELREDNVTTNSIQLTWRMPNYDNYRQKGLLWEVQVQPEGMPAQNRTEQVTLVRESRRRQELRLQLIDLPYAYFSYTLRMRVKLNTSVTWSPTFEHTFRTKAQQPGKPPLISAGSFYIGPSENTVRLYWEELQNFEYNGPNFSYAITEVRKDGQKM